MFHACTSPSSNTWTFFFTVDHRPWFLTMPPSGSEPGRPARHAYRLRHPQSDPGVAAHRVHGRRRRRLPADLPPGGVPGAHSHAALQPDQRAGRVRAGQPRTWRGGGGACVLGVGARQERAHHTRGRHAEGGRTENQTR